MYVIPNNKFVLFAYIFIYRSLQYHHTIGHMRFYQLPAATMHLQAGGREIIHQSGRCRYYVCTYVLTLINIDTSADYGRCNIWIAGFAF